MAREKYIGQKCVSCRALLNKNDDIVVCPECGSPYHRECYKNEGKCINTVLHENGEEWKPETPHAHIHTHVSPIAEEIATGPIAENSADPAPAEQPGVASYQEEYTKHYCPVCNHETNPDDAFCPKCGTQLGTNVNKKNICPVCRFENRPNETFCVRCGTPLDMEKATSQGAFYGSPFINVHQFKPESNIDGNTVDEYTRYVGGRFFSFVPKFLRFAKEGTKLSFNMWAFIFPEFYFFYRKMNAIGTLSFIITILLSVPGTIANLAASNILSSSLLTNPTLEIAVSLFYILLTTFRFACGIFADWFYYKKAKTDIEKIKQTVLEPEARKHSITVKGGTSWTGVLVAATVTVIISMAASVIAMAFSVM